MPAAAGTHPGLIRRPGGARRGISQVHLFATTLAADVQTDVTHETILAQSPIRNPEACRIWTGMIPGIVLAGGTVVADGTAQAAAAGAPDGESFLERVTRVLLDGRRRGRHRRFSDQTPLPFGGPAGRDGCASARGREPGLRTGAAVLAARRASRGRPAGSARRAGDAGRRPARFGRHGSVHPARVPGERRRPDYPSRPATGATGIR